MSRTMSVLEAIILSFVAAAAGLSAACLSIVLIRAFIRATVMR
jgi:hypothetical protein